MEGRKEEGEKALCYEGDAQGQNYCEKKCKLSHEREEVSYIAKTSVSIDNTNKQANPLFIITQKFIHLYDVIFDSYIYTLDNTI